MKFKVGDIVKANAEGANRYSLAGSGMHKGLVESTGGKYMSIAVLSHNDPDRVGRHPLVEYPYFDLCLDLFTCEELLRLPEGQKVWVKEPVGSIFKSAWHLVEASGGEKLLRIVGGQAYYEIEAELCEDGTTVWPSPEAAQAAKKAEEPKPSEPESPQYTFDDFKAGKFGIRCETREQYDRLMQECEKAGIRWINSGESPTKWKNGYINELWKTYTQGVNKRGELCNDRHETVIPFTSISFPADRPERPATPAPDEEIRIETLRKLRSDLTYKLDDERSGKNWVKLSQELREVMRELAFCHE